MSTIMMGPPTNSASVNCHQMSTARIAPNSTTRLVEAISNAHRSGKTGSTLKQSTGESDRRIGA
jgi:hypothetical protein